MLSNKIYRWKATQIRSLRSVGENVRMLTTESRPSSQKMILLQDLGRRLSQVFSFSVSDGALRHGLPRIWGFNIYLCFAGTFKTCNKSRRGELLLLSYFLSREKWDGPMLSNLAHLIAVKKGSSQRTEPGSLIPDVSLCIAVLHFLPANIRGVSMLGMYRMRPYRMYGQKRNQVFHLKKIKAHRLE